MVGVAAHQPPQVDLVGQHERAHQPRLAAQPLDQPVTQRLHCLLGRLGGGDGLTQWPGEPGVNLRSGDGEEVFQGCLG